MLRPETVSERGKQCFARQGGRQCMRGSVQGSPRLSRSFSKSKSFTPAFHHFLLSKRAVRCRAYRTRKAVEVSALVAFDYAQPALWLGTALIGGGVGLYNLRNVQPVVAKDSDVALSCILVFSGGILIFQGWRLDPLLLFVQICLSGMALTWALEVIKLRKRIDEDEAFDGRRRQGVQLEDSRRRGRSSGDKNMLPAASRDGDYERWYSGQAESQQGYGRWPEDEVEEPEYDRWYQGKRRDEDLSGAASVSGRGFYSGRGQESYYPSPDYPYQPAGPSQEFDYDQENYRVMPEDRGYGAFQNPGDPYASREADARSQEYQSVGQGYEWGPEDYDSRQREAWGQGDRGSFQGGQDSLNMYSRGENAFLPASGDPVPEFEGDPYNSKILDEVQSFYNRPESVVEDVEKFYDVNGQKADPSQEAGEQESRKIRGNGADEPVQYRSRQ